MAQMQPGWRALIRPAIPVCDVLSQVSYRENQRFCLPCGLELEHWQRSDGGTCPKTCSKWAPHPVHVGRWHLLQVIAVHIPIWV